MKNHPDRIVIIGATSAIAQECARVWAIESPADFVLVGRDIERLKVVAADIKVRSPDSRIELRVSDFFKPASIQDLADSIFSQGSVDIALIAQGSLPDQDACQADLGKCSEAISVNALSPVLFAEAFAGHMQKLDKGTIAVTGSVAGDRGRKSNYVYGAAKGLVDRYCQGLQHRLAKSAVRTVLIKPGPTDTPMTAALKSQGAKLASVEIVAKHIVKGIKQGKSTIYVPKKWALIMLIIRHLPGFIFNKLDI